MTTDALVTLTIDEGVAVVTLADAASGNALSEPMVHALTAALAQSGRDPRTRVIVLDARGDMFSAGAPRELLEQLAHGSLEPHDIQLPRTLLACPVPVVAAMAGHAIGGGFALGLAADIILIARECRYGFSFMDLGFTPGMGVTRLCEHVLSPAIAHELMYTGELRRGAELAAISGVNYVLPAHEVRGKAMDLARRIAEKPRAALEALKRTLTLPRRRLFEETITLETLMHQVTLRDPEAMARIQRGLDGVTAK